MSYSLDYLSNNETRRELMNKVALYLNSYSNEWRDRKAIKLEDIYTLWLISLSIGLFGSEKDEEYYHLGSEILLRLKIILENTASPSPSFFGGLADVSFAIIQFNKTTGGYSRFSDQVYKYCVALIKEYSQQCIDQLHDVRFSHYDTISGLSGMGYFILSNYQKTPAEYDAIMTIADFMGKLSDSSDGIPFWHIKPENRATDEDKANFPHGHLNFSLSHGIVGPLAFLLLAYKNGFRQEALTHALSTFYSVVEQSAVAVDGAVFWPTKVPLELYLAGKYGYSKNYSWCYGMPSILRVIELTSDVVEMPWATDKINELFDYLLIHSDRIDFPENILCHGHTGFLCVLESHYFGRTSKENAERLRSLFKNAVRRIQSSNNPEHYGNFLDGSIGELIALLSICKNDTSVFQHLMLN